MNYGNGNASLYRSSSSVVTNPVLVPDSPIGVTNGSSNGNGNSGSSGFAGLSSSLYRGDSDGTLGMDPTAHPGGLSTYGYTTTLAHESSASSFTNPEMQRQQTQGAGSGSSSAGGGARRLAPFPTGGVGSAARTTTTTTTTAGAARNRDALPSLIQQEPSFYRNPENGQDPGMPS